MKKRHFRGLRASCILAPLALLLPASAIAQSTNATISGTVADPTGAAVPNAQLTLTSVATGSVAKTTSGPDGLFSFPNLQPGIYELRAAAQGFRDFVQTYNRDVLPTLASTSRQRSLSVLKNYLIPEFGGLMLREITLEPLQAYFTGLQQSKLSNASIDKVRDVLSAVLRTAVD